MEFLRAGSGGLLAGYRFDRAGTDLHLLFADPHSFPTCLLFAHLNAHAPGTAVMGGLVSGAAVPGLTRLFCEGKVLESGAVGVRLPGLYARPVVSQGCRESRRTRHPAISLMKAEPAASAWGEATGEPSQCRGQSGDR